MSNQIHPRLLLLIPIREDVQHYIYLTDNIRIHEIFVRAIIMVIGFYIVTSFLLALVRSLLNYNLKNKLIHKGLIGPEAQNLLETQKENSIYAVKWFLLLLGAGAGFGLMSLFPFGWLSVALLAWCLSMSFLAFHYYLKYNPNP